jgi:hypothetical protein
MGAGWFAFLQDIYQKSPAAKRFPDVCDFPMCQKNRAPVRGFSVFSGGKCDYDAWIINGQ